MRHTTKFTHLTFVAIYAGMGLCAPVSALDPANSPAVNQETPEERKARVQDLKKLKKAQRDQKRAETAAQESQMETMGGCCAGDYSAYLRSKSLMRVISSKALDQDLSVLSAKPQELARVQKAISITDGLMQDHINENLYLYGKFSLYKNSKKLNDFYDFHWGQFYKNKIAATLKEFRDFHTERQHSSRTGPPSSVTNYWNIACPITQRTNLRIDKEKIVIGYKFLHIASVDNPNSEDINLNFDSKGILSIIYFSLDKNFKYLPFDEANTGWWYTNYGTQGQDAMTQIKSNLINLSSQKNKFSLAERENFKNLLTEFENAEKACNKPNLFN